MAPLLLAGSAALFVIFAPKFAAHMCLCALLGVASSDGETNPHLKAVFKLIPQNSSGNKPKHMCKITLTSPTTVTGLLFLGSNPNGDPRAWTTLMLNNESVCLHADRAIDLLYKSFLADNVYYRVVLELEERKLLYSNIYVKNPDDFSAVDWEEVQANEKKQAYIGIGIIIVVLVITIAISVYICRMFAVKH